MTGRLITFEGVEGAGKTTQIALLRVALESAGHRVFVTREPGGDPLGEAIRGLLLATTLPAADASHSSVENRPVPAAELLLFLASRAQMTARILRPQLEAGAVVLCDRFIDSSVAYQGHARGQDPATVRGLNRFATGGLLPDATILLDLDPLQGLARQQERNRMEAESLAFHQRVRAGYLAEAALEPARFHLFDATLAPDALHAHILNAVLPLMPGS